MKSKFLTRLLRFILAIFLALVVSFIANKTGLDPFLEGWLSCLTFCGVFFGYKIFGNY
jgi:hypothetical protein